jgi:hypothetical protein
MWLCANGHGDCQFPISPGGRNNDLISPTTNISSHFTFTVQWRHRFYICSRFQLLYWGTDRGYPPLLLARTSTTSVCWVVVTSWPGNTLSLRTSHIFWSHNPIFDRHAKYLPNWWVLSPWACNMDSKIAQIPPCPPPPTTSNWIVPPYKVGLVRPRWTWPLKNLLVQGCIKEKDVGGLWSTSGNFIILWSFGAGFPAFSDTNVLYTTSIYL